MNELKLNIVLVKKEMKRAKMTRAELCKKWGISRSLAYYVFKFKPLSYAAKFGKLFHRPAKDFIV